MLVLRGMDDTIAPKADAAELLKELAIYHFYLLQFGREVDHERGLKYQFRLV
jgi:hypothetical protein